MTARSVIIKTAAEDDVRDIARYIARDSPRSAERFGQEFGLAIDRISAFPEMGRKYNVPPFELRLARVSARFRRYLIVYRIDGEDIRVVRVLHGAMDIGRHLSKSDIT